MKKWQRFLTGTGITVLVGSAGILAVLPAILAQQKKPSDPSEDQVAVNQLNTALSGTSFKTMSQMVAYLTVKGYDLESKVASNNDQYVWDSENNVIFTMNENNEVSTKPEGKTITSNKYKIWKMVDIKSSNSKTESFNKTSEYGQYLRSGQKVTTTQENPLSFSCNIDTGFNENLCLKYEKPEVTTLEYTPKIVTYCSDLEIDGSIGDIDHYGNAKSITVTKIEDTYNEYGTVDGNIVLKQGDFVAKPTADVNTILVESTEVGTITLKAEGEDAATVGTIAKTSDDITLVVDKSEIPEAKQPDIPAQTVDPASDGFAGGMGTLKSPYAISTPDQLKYCATKVNSSTLSEDNTLNFILLNDIDMVNEGVFTSIGTKGNPFYGVFEGNGCTIKHLKITEASVASPDWTGGFGLFGWTGGKKNTAFLQKTDAWDYDNEELKSENLSENNYSTKIQNLSLEAVDVYMEYHDPEGEIPNRRSSSALIGTSINTYVSNCHVLSGEIVGWKGVGGIIGEMSGSVCYGCSVGSSDKTTSILIRGNNQEEAHNIAGVVGTVDLMTDIQSCSAIIGCWTGENCTVDAMATDGTAAGIVTYCDTVHTLILDGCVNNATIQTEGQGDSTSSIAGVASYGVHTDVVANCTNNGLIQTVGDNATIGYAAGVAATPTGVHLYNCRNKGCINAKAVVGVAGVAMGCSSTTELVECYCDVTIDKLVNTYDPDLVWLVSDKEELTILR